MLTARIIQLGTAVQRICEAGHAGEAHPIVRSMVSACVILSYIMEDRDGRAAAYREMDRIERKKRIADMRREQEKAAKAEMGFFISPERLAEYERQDAELTAIEDRTSSVLARHGIVPTRLGPRTDTFTGLNNERELFERMNGLRWYLTYYKLFSDEIHVSANALSAEMVEQISGQNVVGAKFEDPLYVLAASTEMVINALELLDRAFELHQDAALKAIDAPIAAALTEYAKQTGR
ncbi:MAG: DUF5677 domain-containing protein [Candidatus Dormibacteraeota bacterium]|nr:DUF5677 domain-containing protein [Candidatus Dormibacteraeota bacterium]